LRRGPVFKADAHRELFRRRASAAVLGGIVALAGTTASAQTWHFTPSVALQETLTNNVNLSPSATAKSDLVTQLTPQLAIDEKGARTSLRGVIAAPMLVYARTGAENNQVYPSVNLLGTVEGIERFFFVDGAINVSQQFFTPFGAQPQNLANATENRYTAAWYRVSPYIQGITPGNIRYEVRNNNTWTNLSGAPIATNNSHITEWLGRVSSPINPYGWAVDYDGTDVKFNDQRPTITHLARAILRYQVDPQFRLDVDGGYEENQYPLVNYRGAIYGAGVQWNPTPRTSVVGNWEYRFFGSSYLFAFEHRTPLSSVKVQASRNATSYPQQFLTLPATGNVPVLLYFLLQTRIPDPAQRIEAIEKLIREQGLPNALTSPVNLYTQQTYLLENANATLGLLGARNIMLFTVFYAKSQPITGAGAPLPGLLAAVNNNTQTGAGIVWNHDLTAQLTLTTSCTAVRTVAAAPLVGTTNQGNCLLGVTAPLSPNTIVSAGARYQTGRSDVSLAYNEAAIFAGINYKFK
jgi:uncharacterized protein (PEP-CTERM system associated)